MSDDEQFLKHLYFLRKKHFNQLECFTRNYVSSHLTDVAERLSILSPSGPSEAQTRALLAGCYRKFYQANPVGAYESDYNLGQAARKTRDERRTTIEQCFMRLMHTTTINGIYPEIITISSLLLTPPNWGELLTDFNEIAAGKSKEIYTKWVEGLYYQPENRSPKDNTEPTITKSKELPVES